MSVVAGRRREHPGVNRHEERVPGRRQRAPTSIGTSPAVELVRATVALEREVVESERASLPSRRAAVLDRRSRLRPRSRTTDSRTVRDEGDRDRRRTPVLGDRDGGAVLLDFAVAATSPARPPSPSIRVGSVDLPTDVAVLAGKQDPDRVLQRRAVQRISSASTVRADVRRPKVSEYDLLCAG